MPVKSKAATSNGAAEVPATPQITIQRLERGTLFVPIRGTAPFICHRFSEKAKGQMLDNSTGVKRAKTPKNPQEEYAAAFHRFKDGDLRAGFPVIGFKQATVSGARLYSQLTMTGLRQCLFFRGEVGAEGQMLAQIDGPEGSIADPDDEDTGQVYRREDVVRLNKMGSTDLRYRPCWPEWTTLLEVIFVKSMLTKDSVLSLIDAGGLTVGVGEWRPEKGGDFGTYEIDSTRQIRELDL
jgi:hypothetical protein